MLNWSSVASVCLFILDIAWFILAANKATSPVVAVPNKPLLSFPTKPSMGSLARLVLFRLSSSMGDLSMWSIASVASLMSLMRYSYCCNSSQSRAKQKDKNALSLLLSAQDLNGLHSGLLIANIKSYTDEATNSFLFKG